MKRCPIEARIVATDPFDSNDPTRKRSSNSLQALQPVIAGSSDLTAYWMLYGYSGKIDIARAYSSKATKLDLAWWQELQGQLDACQNEIAAVLGETILVNPVTPQDACVSRSENASMNALATPIRAGSANGSTLAISAPCKNLVCCRSNYHKACAGGDFT